MKPNIGQGDSGKTSLLGGKTKVWKDNPQVEAYGSLDELVSLIGFVRSKNKEEKINDVLIKIQDHLFRVESHISASPKWKNHPALPYVGKEHIEFLEETIGEYEKNLPELRNFILPGGNELAALLHMARAESRSVERKLVTLARTKKVHPFAIPYVNRLSDVFFAVARWVNWQSGIKDINWIGRGKRDL